MIISNQLIFYIKGVLNTSMNQVYFICNDIEIIETYLELSPIVYYQNSRDRQKHIKNQFKQEKGKKSRSLFRGMLENPIESMSWQHFRNRLEPCGKPSVCCFSLSLCTLAPFWLCCILPFSIPQLSSVVWLPVTTVHPDTGTGVPVQENRSCFGRTWLFQKLCGT